MTTVARTYPGEVYQDEPSFLAALRRAKWMLFAVVVVTAVVCLKETFTDHGPDGWSGSLTRHFVGIAFTVAMCWYAFRGGELSGGCLAVGYTSTLLSLGIGMGLATGIYLGLHPLTLATIGGASGSVLSLIGTSAWCVFSLWVLVGSRDVRLYREVRRLSLTPEEAFVRRGRPFGQRPQPSIHAP